MARSPPGRFLLPRLPIRPGASLPVSPGGDRLATGADKKRGGAEAPPLGQTPKSRPYGQAFPSAAISLSRPAASFALPVL